MNIPDTPEEIQEAIARLDWDLCEVQLTVVKKKTFGFFGKSVLIFGKWEAREIIHPNGSRSAPPLQPTIAKQRFAVDARLGENYDEKMTKAFEDLMGELFRQGWELSADADPYTRPIFLRCPPTSMS